MKITSRQQDLISYLQSLRKEIIQAFERLESSHRFEYKPWQHPTGGGGEIGLLRGAVFEKAAVNWSAVRGDHFPMDDSTGPFFATGVSLITHMKNPHAPTVHFNIRYIETEERFWFGGGYDLTPMGFPYAEDTDYFHAIAKSSLDTLDAALYPLFSQQAKDYFFIKHWKKERGVGGIFFDHYNTGNFDQDLKLWRTVGDTFLEAIIPIYQKRIQSAYSEADRELQLKMRAHYVEFNLLYDRGTKFGVQSGGNPEAFLGSMPPLAAW